MEPSSVFRTIWRQRWFAFPAIILTLVAASLVFFYGPREYESSASYALVDPQVPTQEQIDQNPALRLLNSDNPYLRSTDPNLIANVLITRLNAPATQESMKAKGLSSDYEATPGIGGAGLIVTISATGPTQRESLATTAELGRILIANLRSVQKINGADDRYLFTALVVDNPDRATEKLSSRLRTVIIVAIGGIILIFGAVSLGNAIDTGRRRRQEKSEGARRDAERVEMERADADRRTQELLAAEEAERASALASGPTQSTARKPRKRPAQPRPKTATRSWAQDTAAGDDAPTDPQ